MKKTGRLMILFAALAILVLSAVTSRQGQLISFYAIPYDALRSMIRMTAAYFASILFSFAYAYAMYANRHAEKILQPILDILQSVPILGFFPFAIFLFVRAVNGNEIGWEFASIFLIFTSMTWNMTFGIFDSFVGIPEDLKQTSKLYGLSGWRRFRDLYFPATVPKLVYNSMMSWAAGWYFLVPAEYIASVAKGGAVLPGIGSMLYVSAQKGDISLMTATFAFLILIIVIMDIIIWRPLNAWSEKYKYEYTAVSTGTHQINQFPMRRYFQWIPVRSGTGRAISGAVRRGAEGFNTAGHKIATFYADTRRVWRYVFAAAGIIIVVGIIVGAVEAISSIYKLLIVSGKIYAAVLPLALGLSLARLVIAYIISLAIALPLAIVSTRRGSGRLIMPIAEIVASVPATAVFPIIVFVLIGVTHGLNIPAILLITTGMVWYLFFNLAAGMRTIPSEIIEAARNYGLKGSLYAKRVLLPAMFPSLVTGSITAFGGGWNALIVSEYVQSISPNTPPYSVLGIGELIDRAAYATPPNTPLLILSLIVMILAVIAINRLFWKRLQGIAERKYRIEGVS